MQNSKYSRQRELLLSMLKGRKDHPTADELYLSLREHIPNISLGTVYRNLSLLCDIGAIQKIPAADGADRYDGNPMSHYHFRCTSCGAVSDVELPVQTGLDEMAAEVLGAQVDGHSTTFYGRCSHCLSAKH